MSDLNVKLAEDLHRAIEMGIDVVPVVTNLKQATLSGLLEYACIYWSNSRAIPELPSPVMTSRLGTGLIGIESELGFRPSSRMKRSATRIDPLPIEFVTVRTEDDFENREWECFEIRFCRSAESVGFSRTIALGLQGALREMAENAVIHSESPLPAIIAYRAVQGMAQFCVVDVGIGVLASLRKCADFHDIERHNEAIRMALRDGVSRFGRNTRGLGFHAVFKALLANWGYLRFRSGEGCITMDGSGLDADHGEATFPPYLPGFQVTVCCRVAGMATGTPTA
jgi:hypothetical protein